jgi:hypothetical protein
MFKAPVVHLIRGEFTAILETSAAVKNNLSPNSSERFQTVTNVCKPFRDRFRLVYGDP